MDLSIITITWNSAAHIAEQIRSVISACSGITFEHIIVDNASGDRTIEEVSKFQHVMLMRNKRNVGFAAANNQAYKDATGEYILLLNPDMRLMPGSLDLFVEWMKAHPTVGIAGCRLVNEAGQINNSTTPRQFPKLFDQLAIFLKLPHLFPHILDRYLMRGADWTKEQAVDTAQGSCMLIRRELLQKLGRIFDERYFIWFEDVDLCREAKRLGYSVMYTLIISCVDYGAQSFWQRNVVWKQWQFFRSAVKYFWKWGIKNS